MARTQWRNKFDRERDFVVRKALTLGGVKHAPGEPFDKSLVTTRRLRQLFDSRTIMFAGENPGAPSDQLTTLRGPARRAQERRLAKASAKTRAADPNPRGQLDIPDDWPHMPWPQRLALASKLTDEKVHNGPEAAAAIEAELARRAGTP